MRYFSAIFVWRWTIYDRNCYEREAELGKLNTLAAIAEHVIYMRKQRNTKEKLYESIIAYVNHMKLTELLNRKFVSIQVSEMCPDCNIERNENFSTFVLVNFLIPRWLIRVDYFINFEKNIMFGIQISRQI